MSNPQTFSVAFVNADGSIVPVVAGEPTTITTPDGTPFTLGVPTFIDATGEKPVVPEAPASEGQ